MDPQTQAYHALLWVLDEQFSDQVLRQRRHVCWKLEIDLLTTADARTHWHWSVTLYLTHTLLPRQGYL